MSYNSESLNEAGEAMCISCRKNFLYMNWKIVPYVKNLFVNHAPHIENKGIPMDTFARSAWRD